MKISCETIKDLLPLYHDDVCSNESRTTIEEHLLECDTCKEYLNSMDSDIIETNAEKAAEQAKSGILKEIKKKLLRKNVIISAISAICAIAIALGVYSLIFHYEIPIYYEDGLVSVEVGSNGKADVTFNGDDYYCSYSYPCPIEKDGVTEYVAYVYYTDSIWTKYFSKPDKDKEYKYSISNSAFFDYDNGEGLVEVKKEIVAVYYYDYTKEVSTEELIKNSSNAPLLWKK